MSEWKRVTREVLFEGLNPGMVEAVNAHIERYNLGPILSGALMCVQTDSEKVKKGLFGKAEMVSVGAVVTPRWLVWVVSGAKKEYTVMSVQLRDVAIQDYAQTPFAKMVPDSGIEVSGRFTDVSESGSAWTMARRGGGSKRWRCKPRRMRRNKITPNVHGSDPGP